MRCMEVNGADIHSDIALIKRKLTEDSEFVFLYAGKGAIHDYIHALHEGGKGLDDEVLYKLRICYASKNLNVTFFSENGSGFRDYITSMKCLIEALDTTSPCCIAVSSDSREEFAFIVQQLIYIQYPLDKADIFLSQEIRDTDSMPRFLQELGDKHTAYGKIQKELIQLFQPMLSESQVSPSHMKLLDNLDLILECCNKINAYWGKLLEAVRDDDLKLAIAATKKTGKSVIVNSLIGQNLASADVQLATPGNFIYQQSSDNRYHLWMEDDEHNQLFHKMYDSRSDLCRDAEGLCLYAQNDKDNGFALRDAHIGYPASGDQLTSFIVYDTPGPDAAGTNHREAARRALNECDAALFCIDYSKYLTDSEAEYLKEVKDIFKAQQKFHSLLFVLNKMDARYADAKQCKSIAGAVDFIKTRLSQIADEYRDCIIFPVSALEYFNAAVAERAGVTELNTLLSANEVKKLKFARRDVPELSWLHTHSLNLECYHGIKEFSYDVFKRDSGMPELISYLTRVAARRSRVETINHAASEIKQQYQTFYTILDNSGIHFRGIRMKCVEVDGQDISSDIKLINSKLKENSGVIFVYTGDGTIYDYIHALYDNGNGLNDEALYKFKVCYANDKLNITVISHDGNGAELSRLELTSMTQLLETLDGKTACRIVVNSDKREELAFIVQQLIYIQYPLEQEKFEILLRQEEIDADKIKRFKQRVDDLKDTCAKSVDRLGELFDQTKHESPDAPSHAERLSDTKSALECCKSIQKNLDKARMVELKLAVAATKKTGKSVVVNSVIGEELAPTDVQLATPNNCIYQKSRDNKYRLWMEGDNGKVKEYDSSKEIWQDIEDLFRSAQTDLKHGFVLPDMHIEYCAPGNNFSSYTIYDTPGPDAAGTNHKEPARRAINKCDVVVFCIDYSKYLTDSEASYLKEVKDIFKAQQKFHSLIFALNKIDARYQDSKQSKSIVQAVDFVKTRLAKIGNEYRDCIIFPTSSLEYFNAVEAENNGVSELSAPIPSDQLKKVKFAHRDVPALAWLHTQSENLEYYHGIEEFSYDVFKQDSGMPALMNYVSYVASSKAREEIINHVAYDIAQQNIKLNTILSTVTNLEALIKADTSQISEIKKILDEYMRESEIVLTEEFTPIDMKLLPKDSMFRQEYGGNLNKAVERTKALIADACQENEFLGQVYNLVFYKMWKKLESYNGKIVEKDKLQEVTNSLLSNADINEILQNFCTEVSTQAGGTFYNELKIIKKELELIGSDRQRRVRMVTERVKNDLKKQNVDLKLPELPNVQFSSEIHSPDMTEISVSNVNIVNLKWDDLFSPEYGFMETLFSVVTFGKHKREHKGGSLNITFDDFKTICDEKKVRSDVENVLLKAHVLDKIKHEMERILITGYVEVMIKDLETAFADMLRVQKDCVKRFCTIIDDREKYRQHIEQQTARKDSIRQIQNCTKDFMDIWNVVISTVAAA